MSGWLAPYRAVPGAPPLVKDARHVRFHVICRDIREGLAETFDGSGSLGPAAFEILEPAHAGSVPLSLHRFTCMLHESPRLLNRDRCAEALLRHRNRASIAPPLQVTRTPRPGREALAAHDGPVQRASRATR